MNPRPFCLLATCSATTLWLPPRESQPQPKNTLVHFGLGLGWAGQGRARGDRPPLREGGEEVSQEAGANDCWRKRKETAGLCVGMDGPAKPRTCKAENCQEGARLGQTQLFFSADKPKRSALNLCLSPSYHENVPALLVKATMKVGRD